MVERSPAKQDPVRWTKVQYRIVPSAAYDLEMNSSVRDVLRGRSGAWCLDCLVRHTRDRASDVMRELEALPAHTEEGRCGTCREVGAVFLSPRK